MQAGRNTVSFDYFRAHLTDRAPVYAIGIQRSTMQQSISTIESSSGSRSGRSSSCKVRFSRVYRDQQLIYRAGKIADMYTKMNAARSYVYAVARACDAGKVSRRVSCSSPFYTAARG